LKTLMFFLVFQTRAEKPLYKWISIPSLHRMCKLDFWLLCNGNLETG
jgi:hypothetical protein